MRPALMFRLKAACIHLLGSSGVIGLFLWLVYGYWYAHPFEIIFSTLDVVKVLVSVDLVMGPLLTLIVFNIVKPRKELIRDLTIILAFQLSALAWGVYITYSVRPQFAIYFDNEVYVVTAKDINMQALPTDVRPPSLFEPPVSVYVQPLQTAEEIQRHVMEMLNKGVPDIMYQAERFRPYAANSQIAAAEIAAKAGNLSKPSTGQQIWMDSVSASYGGSREDYAFIKVIAGSYTSVVAMRLKDGKLVDVKL